jgi:hypothetical protein
MGGFKTGSVDSWDEENETSDSGEETTQEVQPDDAEQESGTGAAESATTVGSKYDTLPWVLTRSSITDGRENTVQLHLQNSTSEFERQQHSEIEQLLKEDVKKADLREAALLIGLQHSGEVADKLREWGYAIEATTDS